MDPEKKAFHGSCWEGSQLLLLYLVLPVQSPLCNTEVPPSGSPIPYPFQEPSLYLQTLHFDLSPFPFCLTWSPTGRGGRKAGKFVLTWKMAAHLKN